METTAWAIFYHRLIWGSVAAFFLLYLAACNGLKPSNEPLPGSESVTVERIEVGERSLLPGGEMHFAVYGDGDSFRAAYARIHAGTLPKPAAPAVDHTRWLVVGAFLGQRPTANHGIELGPAWTAADSSGTYLEMKVRETKPPAGSLAAQVVTSPYALVKIPREQWGRVRFVGPEGRLLAEVPVRDP